MSERLGSYLWQRHFCAHDIGSGSTDSPLDICGCKSKAMLREEAERKKLTSLIGQLELCDLT